MMLMRQRLMSSSLTIFTRVEKTYLNDETRSDITKIRKIMFTAADCIII